MIHFSKLIILVLCASLIVGCSTLAQQSDTGVVVARRAQIRSSTAVVAADLLEVERGDFVDILESVDVQDPTDNARRERWFRVRAHDNESTEGWIEARNLILEDVLEASKRIAEEDKDIAPQATGQLRASSNLRLSPDRSGNENILMRLDSGSSFYIIGWKRVPKPGSSESIESDIAPKAGSAQQGGRSSRPNQNTAAVPEEINELWYKVRLPPDTSPAPAGWIYGKQVELTVPSDIIFYRTGREFVAWQRLDADPDEKTGAATDKDAAKEERPGSWVILEKSSSNQPRPLDEPDFDRIYVIGYDKRTQDHYTAYRSRNVEGFLPLRVEGRGDNRIISVRVREGGIEVKEEQYIAYKDARGVLRITPPTAPQRERRRK